MFRILRRPHKVESLLPWNVELKKARKLKGQVRALISRLRIISTW